MSEIMRELTPEELEAIKALEARGITATPRLVSEWIAQRRRQEQPQGAGQGRLYRLTDSRPEATEAARPPARKNRGGRPAREEPWLEEAAKLVASRMTLRKALEKLGVPFTNQDLNNIQRLVRFRHDLEKHRQGG